MGLEESWHICLAELLSAILSGRAADCSLEEVTEGKRVTEADTFGDLGDGVPLLQQHGGGFVETQLFQVLGERKAHITLKYVGGILFGIAEKAREFLQRDSFTDAIREKCAEALRHGILAVRSYARPFAQQENLP